MLGLSSLCSLYSWVELLFAADPSFPRGPGFYFSLFKVVPVIILYLCWVRTCWWIDQDANEVGLPATTWNSVMLGCGIFGLLIVWALPWPWFIVSFLLLVILYLTPTIIYVNARNQLVPAAERLLTQRHLRRLLKMGPADEVETERRVPVRFIGKSFNQTDEDQSRVARAESSRGYKAALTMIYEAIEARATDIHLEPTKEQVAVRYRIDGILQAADPFERHRGDSVINIFKVLAALDITEKRKPQDGSFSAQVEDRQVDFRVATSGSVAGEKMVIRILDTATQIANLTQLGMRDRMRESIHNIVMQPHGLFIVCGPTGAGKSTTLYACLQEIDRFQKNVISVENPVEYHIDNVTQIEVNVRAGKTFAGELRSLLRQDPDVIYIGEVRDQETAEIACQAAQTGHMVFTTLHANDTVTALARLFDLGVQPYLVGSAVTAILGQRLVRVLCPECKVRYKPDPEMLRKANLPADKIKHFYKPRVEESEDTEDSGERQICENCGGTGYHGRTGVFELLIFTDRMREMIRDKPNLNALRQEAVKNGMKYLQEDGLRQVIEGKTSIQELLRVCK
jgi:general secretion pathway protein E